MKICFLALLLMITCLIISCNHNFKDNPGPQISSSIDVAKKHHTFISAFKINDGEINGVKIECVFAEKKYSLEEGVFGRFDISCCKSQLVIVSKEPFNILTLNDVPQNWEIVGFYPMYEKVCVRTYKGNAFPDTINISFRQNVKNKDDLEKIALYKIKEK